MDSKSLAELCRGAQEAVRAAGEIIRAHWDRPRKVTHKGRIDLVTETDVAVEAALRESLGALYPDAGYYAEESAGDMPLPETAWIVDPVDGTTNFVHRVPFVAVSVGIRSAGEMVGGIIYNPILDELFWAAKGQGAYLNGSPIAVSETETLEASLLATGFPYAIFEYENKILDKLKSVLEQTQGIRRCGAAALDFAYVACGRFDGFYEYALHPWDMAAGWCILEEAGGKVSRFGSSQQTSFDLFSETVLASNGRLHTQLAQMLAE